jgi:hypothetical protein
LQWLSIAHLPPLHTNFAVVSLSLSESCIGETYDNGSILDTARMRVVLGAAERAWIADVAQIAPAEVDTAAAFESRAAEYRALFDGDRVGGNQQRHSGEEGEDLGELHVDGRIRM